MFTFHFFEIQVDNLFIYNDLDSTLGSVCFLRSKYRKFPYKKV